MPEVVDIVRGGRANCPVDWRLKLRPVGEIGCVVLRGSVRPVAPSREIPVFWRDILVIGGGEFGC